MNCKITGFLALLLAVLAIQASPKKGDDDKKPTRVTIKDMKYDPAKVTIQPGQTVTWTNQDDHDHTVVADDNSFKSPNIRSGESFSRKFDKKGKFSYSCTYHPRMKGVVLVTDTVN